jgi:hypothetical protein
MDRRRGLLDLLVCWISSPLTARATATCTSHVVVERAEQVAVAIPCPFRGSDTASRMEDGYGRGRSGRALVTSPPPSQPEPALRACICLAGSRRGVTHATPLPICSVLCTRSMLPRSRTQQQQPIGSVGFRAYPCMLCKWKANSKWRSGLSLPEPLQLPVTNSHANA